MLGLLQGESAEVALSHLLHIDLAANPFVEKRDEGRIFIDGHAMAFRPVDGPLRDGFPGVGVRAHLASTWELSDGRRHLSGGRSRRDLKSVAINNI
ncbi:hypothetical protein LPU83_pLPU83a_0122 (plasmid) [Rhizobium favelukesii]|uniref:Uncharacterized protein n=1 Tax=Rhizobium favelukesii TaxID=348824 RepID=W6RM05_9HYPH|nr:hypothetical protein LPU83_pLPU83a_0122 [Rhizobium favelukesii]